MKNYVVANEETSIELFQSEENAVVIKWYGKASKVNGMKHLWHATAIIVGIVVSFLLNGYAISVLWGWFIVPTFSAPPLNIPSAIGVAIIAGYLTKQIKLDDSDDKKPFSQGLFECIALGILKPVLAVACGWFVSIWM